MFGKLSGDQLSVGGNWGNVGIAVQDYKSLCAAVMICNTLVNTQTHTHRQTAFVMPISHRDQHKIVFLFGIGGVN